VLSYGPLEIGIFEIFMTVGKRTAFMIDSSVRVGVNEPNVVSKVKFDD
jgi:hypothetical protein